MAAIKNQGISIVLVIVAFIGGYKVQAYQVAQHEERISAIEQVVPTQREWQELTRRMERIENKVDQLAAQKQDKTR